MMRVFILYFYFYDDYYYYDNDNDGHTLQDGFRFLSTYYYPEYDAGNCSSSSSTSSLEGEWKKAANKQIKFFFYILKWKKNYQEKKG